jgi:hypothetical protein
MGIVKMHLDASHGRDLEAVRATYAAAYGTRYTPQTNAGTALGRNSIGKGPRSVWQGPRQIARGEPVLKRW